MGDWVEPLLYAAAEATALRDWALAARTLDAFSACVAHGAGLEARRPAPARAPVAAHAAPGPAPARARAGGARHAQRARAAEAAGERAGRPAAARGAHGGGRAGAAGRRRRRAARRAARLLERAGARPCCLGRGTRGRRPPAERARRAQALRWICADGATEALRFGCAGALAALAAAPGDAGWRVACAWLGDLLVHLSRQVHAYHAVREARAAPAPAAGLAPESARERFGGAAQARAPVGVAEEVFASAVAVLPVYARGVAAELRATGERAPPWQEPPPTMDDLLAPAAAAPPGAADAAAADAVLARALTVRAV